MFECKALLFFSSAIFTTGNYIYDCGFLFAFLADLSELSSNVKEKIAPMEIIFFSLNIDPTSKDDKVGNNKLSCFPLKGTLRQVLYWSLMLALALLKSHSVV